MEMKFYKCKTCGKIIAMVEETGVPTVCCGESMVELVPNTTDAAVEKHVPVIAQKGNIVEVTVGSVEHPMTPEHYIPWIAIQTKTGNQRKTLKPGNPPKATFALVDGDEVVKAVAYCNLHGLWANK
ncbi:MAG: desulfoferrodoxin [Spirochaetaceae bacterium]|jgi:superoxide reductase|nr:desulfoferrodoxin [Spirochaetaceae bacterium]